MTDDPIREFIRSQKVADHVIEGGVRRLQDDWAKTVSDVVREEPTNEYEYLNDMDGRDILDRIEHQFPGSTDTAGDDERFLSAVRRSETCLWGAENAAERGWTPERQWWYFHEWPESVER